MKRLVIIALALSLMTGCEAPSNGDTNSATATSVEYPYAPKSARVEKRENGPTQAELDTSTQVVVLGTGSPIPDAYRAGASIAVVYKGKAYLFDVGAGSIRRAVEARYKYDIPGLYPTHIDTVFITHMHSDHVLDLSELSQTMWWRRPSKLKAYGPTGLKQMATHIEKMLAPDINVRMSGVQPVSNPDGYKLDVTEISPGIIMEKDGLSVEAFSVPHGDIKPAFGYKIVTPDMSIVISGDTAASETIREKAQGVDILFHEAISQKGLLKSTPFWQNYHKASHTPADELGRIAAAAKPKKLVLYHGIYYGTGESDMIGEVAAHFDGDIYLANDLDIFKAE